MNQPSTNSSALESASHVTRDGVPASGPTYSIIGHGYRADIAGVGAALRTLTLDGRDLVFPYSAHEVRPAFRGALLAPWPNRVVDGRYEFAGSVQQLPLNEVGRGHALHGLVLWTEWALESRSESSVVLSTVVQPQSGYPHRIALTVEYALAADGLTTTVLARNTGEGDAPYGIAPHPYLVAGPGLASEWTMTVPASTVFTAEGDRLLPGDLVDVATHDPERFDFREARVIGAAQLDHAFTDLSRQDGVASVTLAVGDSGVGMSWGTELPWLQIYNGSHDPATPDAAAAAVAVEPMTCPPDAFNSGKDLVVLEAGEAHSASWRIWGW